MPLRNILRRTLLFLLCAAPFPALAAATLTGTVTNRTTGKPSGGDDVVLIRLQQTMQETTHTKTDSKGHYKLDVPEDGMHLVRVTHDKASYFQPVQPGTDTVNMDVYDAAAKIDGVTTAVEELHIEATAGELHIVEVLQVLNNSTPARTQFGPAGFDFFVPPAAHILRSGAQRDGMPVPTTATPVGDPGHYTFLFPIRPGETQFGIFYTLPYVGQQGFDLKLATPVNTVAIVMPRSMTFKAGPGTPWQVAREQGSDPNTQTWTMGSVAVAQPLQFSVSGTGSIPDPAAQNGAQAGAQQGGAAPNGQPLPETQNTAPGRGLQNPLDPEGDRDPWGKYKWWILGVLGLLLAAAAGVLLRRPKNEAGTQTPPSPSGLPSHAPGGPLIAQSHHAMGGVPSHSPLDALKDELFALETDHLQQRITEPEYLEHKAALEIVLRRALTRNAPAAGTTPASTAHEPAFEESSR